MFLLSFLAVLSLLSTATIAFPSTLNLTAISASNGISILECWQLTNHVEVTNQEGIIGSAILQLGDLANASYTVIPPRFDGGRHNAPAVQYGVFLSGLAYITLPNSTSEAWVKGGKKGFIIVADLASVSRLGHETTYPSGEETIALQIPTKDGKVPEHMVLHEGACRREGSRIQ